MTACTIKTLAAAIGARAEGETGMEIDRPCHPDDAKSARDLALAMDASLHDRLRNSPARAAVLLGDTDWKALGLEAAIYVEHARSALVSITGLFARPPELAPGVHPSAVVGPDVELGEGVAIGPFVEIGAGGADRRQQLRPRRRQSRKRGGNRSGLPAVFRGADRRTGADWCPRHPPRQRRARFGRLLVPAGGSGAGRGGCWPAATRCRWVAMGGMCGFIPSGRCGWAMTWKSVPAPRSTGARWRITEIGDGTKIDNLVHIAHNVRIGRNCLICGQVGIAGSARIGDRVILGGQVGVGDHVEIGADCMIGGKSLVGRKVRPGSILVGWASLPRDEFHAVFRAVRRLARKSRDS